MRFFPLGRRDAEITRLKAEVETLKRVIEGCKRREAQLRASAPHDECERLKKELEDLKAKMIEDEKKNMRMKKVRNKRKSYDGFDIYFEKVKRPKKGLMMTVVHQQLREQQQQQQQQQQRRQQQQ